MAIQWGKSPLHNLKSFRARKWFPTEFIKFGTKVADYYQDRNEIVYGIASTAGTTTLTAVKVTTTAGEVVLNGRHFALAALADVDLFTTTGAVGQAIYTDGSDASGLSVTSAGSETIYGSVIVCNSSGAGGLDNTDGGTAIFVAVLNGASAAYTASTASSDAYPSAADIASALEASTVHDGGETASDAPSAKEVSWAYVCDLELVENGGGTLAQTNTKNRNNAVQGH